MIHTHTLQYILPTLYFVPTFITEHYYFEEMYSFHTNSRNGINARHNGNPNLNDIRNWISCSGNIQKPLRNPITSNLQIGYYCSIFAFPIIRSAYYFIQIL